MSVATRQSLTKETKASTLPEAAIVLGVLLPMILGGLEIGLMMWSHTTLQSVANLTARCVAIGSPACANPQQYAGTLSTYWLGKNMIATFGVTTTCPNASGNFDVVTITTSAWAGSIVYAVAPATQTLIACYPRSAS